MNKPIYLLGDIHGKWDIINNWIDKFEIKDSYIIQVGDFGIGFYPSF